MLFLLDIFFDALHIGIIGFNLFGWIFKASRRAHRWLVAATAFCWLVVGPAMGSLGYCPLTDWHWRVKEARGATDLPNSYIDYLLRMAGFHADPQRIDICVGATFAAIVLVTGWLWWREKAARRQVPAAAE